MVSCSMKTGLLILFAAYFFDICQAQTPCTADGWFGTNCQYQCHCAGSTLCDKVDGSCSSGCHQDWFGPACQYDRMGFNGQWQLTDNDKTSCFAGRTTTVTLNTRIPLTWIRVVVNNTAGLNQIQLNYHLTGSSPALACSDLRTAKVNDVTLDISCSTVDRVRRVTLTVPDGTGLCSLDISGGRNVALKQTAHQSSKYGTDPDQFRARYAVDGILPSRSTSAASTCTHTDQPSGPGWWTVTFSQAVDVTRFLVYNRDEDCCRERLRNFKLTARPESPSTDTPYTYNDPNPVQAIYTVVPSPRISFPVKEVRFDTAHYTNILTLCEVFVFGETVCPHGQFGVGCERQCNCANQGSCFVHSGGCPSGCAPGYTGEDCSECQIGKYGDQCQLPCSDTCGGDNSCDRNGGACSQGCDPGYQGTQCKLKCAAMWYGAGCSSRCSSNCAGSDNACHHVSGVCDNCNPGRYKSDCSSFCSINCAGQGNACDRDSGACNEGCDPGYWGQRCWNRCNSTCAGPDNACDRDSGACTEGCDPGHYGVTCSSPCSSNCRRPDNACDGDSGACDEGCDPGYKVPKCDQECDIGSYGEGCQTCSEHCTGDQNSCDHVSGTCDMGCDPGYQGSLCKQKCDATTWGQDCNETCNIECANTSCDHVTGECDCSPGYWGYFCDQVCNATTYGDECLKSCSPDCVNQQCDHVTGRCGSCVDSRIGDFCEILRLEPQSGGGGGADSTIPAVIGAVIAIVVILAVVSGVFLWRRRRKQAGGKSETENGIRGNGGVIGDGVGLPKANDVRESHKNRKSNNHTKRSPAPRFSSAKTNDGYDESSEEDTEDKKGDDLYTNVLTGNTALPVETLKTYILQHSTDSHFKDEFSSIPMANSSSQIAGLSSQNIKKNRYKNIIPYDASRVFLQADAAKGQSDYINASYVKGYKDGETFIASQGPNDAILHDFVRMLWEQRVDRVVMLTNLIEEGKKKCSQYWPVDGEEEFGEVAVKLLTTHVFAEYTVRHLRLSKSGETSRGLTQFHYTAWPDKSVPESPWGLVDLYQRVMSVPGSAPVLIHCSAGVGRTGTFIGLRNLLREAEATGKMDFLSTLWKIRQDRMHTIQTVAQYIFLHKVALVGHVIAGTTIQIKDMYPRLASLESDKGGNKSARSYTQEFNALVEVCEVTSTKSSESPEQQEESVYQNTSGAVDKSKNRLSNLLPNEAFRPVLTAETHKEETYINAVLVPTLTQDSQDILTQVPLPSTVTDFWRLVTQYNAGLVVAFDTDSAGSDETIGEFLPKSEKEPFENDRYRVVTRPPTERRLFKEFSLTVQQRKVPGMDTSGALATKTLTLLLCKNTKLDPESVLELQEQIKSCKPSGKSRVVYTCRNGADQCGLMCVQSILLNRLDVDQCLAVPLVVGSIKAIRPQVIPTVDQYKCLYRVLKLAHDSQNVYGNVGEAPGAP